MDPSQQQPPYSASASPYSHPSSPSPPPVPFPGLASSLAWLAGAPGLPFPQGAFLLIPLQGVTAPATAFPTWAGAQVIPATPSTTNVHTPEQPLQPTVAPGSWPETPLASPMPSTANLHTSVQPLKPTAAPGSLEEALLTPPKPITESVHITALPSKTTAASDHPGGLQKSCAACRKAHVTCDGVQPLCGQCAVLGLVQCCRGRGRPPGSGRRRTSVRSPVQQGVSSTQEPVPTTVPEGRDVSEDQEREDTAVDMDVDNVEHVEKPSSSAEKDAVPPASFEGAPSDPNDDPGDDSDGGGGHDADDDDDDSVISISSDDADEGESGVPRLYRPVTRSMTGGSGSSERMRKGRREEPEEGEEHAGRTRDGAKNSRSVPQQAGARRPRGRPRGSKNKPRNTTPQTPTPTPTPEIAPWIPRQSERLQGKVLPRWYKGGVPEYTRLNLGTFVDRGSTVGSVDPLLMIDNRAALLRDVSRRL